MEVESKISLVALAMLAEYIMIYYCRFTPGRFVGQFHAHYLIVVAVAMTALSWLVCRTPSKSITASGKHGMESAQ